MKPLRYYILAITMTLCVSVLFVRLAKASYIPTATTAGNIGIGTNQPVYGKLVVLGGNVGVGTLVPGAALDVVGTVRATTFSGSGAGLTGITTAGGWTDGTNVVYTTVGADNVGIGTSTPQGALVVTSGNLGVGTWAPEVKLNISNGALLNSTSTVNYYRNVAAYNGNGDVTGTIKITLPKLGSSTMLNITIKGFNYVANENHGNWELNVSGYLLGTAWHGYGAHLRGDAPFTGVRFANDGVNNLILLGTTTTIFNSPKIVVSDVMTGGTAFTGWGTGWSITSITDETGIVNIYTPTMESEGKILRTIPTSVPVSTDATDNSFYLTSGSTHVRLGIIDDGTGVSGRTSYIQGGHLGSLLYYNLILNPLGGNVGIGTTNPFGGQLIVPTTRGNVGIGTLTPGTALDVTGTVRATTFSGSGSGLTGITTAGGWTDDGTSVRQTTSGDRVGIGSVSPNGLLNVVGGGTGTMFRVDDSAAGDTSPFVIDSVGNIGVGTVNPGQRVDFNTGVRSATFTGTSPIGVIIRGDTSGGGYTGLDFNGYYTSGSRDLPNARIAVNADGTGSKLMFGTSNSYGSGITNTAMTINNVGNVGIGSTAPGAKLEIKGDTAFIIRPSSANAQAAISLIGNKAGSDSRWIIASRGGTDTPNDRLSFFDPGSTAERVTFLDGGNVGIGSTAPGAKLEIKGSGTGRMVLGEYGGSSNYAAIGLAGSVATNDYNFASSPGDTNLFINRPSGKNIYFRENSVDYVTFLTGGNVGIGSVSPGKKLDVNGVVRSISGGFTFPDGTTQTTAASAAGWTDGTNVVYTTVGADNVGIGTTTPQGGFVVTNGNVGIGTWVPAGLLDVRKATAYADNSFGAITASGAENKILTMGYDATTNYGWINSVHRNSEVRPLILNPQGGSVGIGYAMTAPATKLEVQAAKSAITTPPITVTDTTASGLGVGGGIVFKGLYQAGAYTEGGAVDAYRESSADGDNFALRLFSRKSGVGLTEGLRITSAGNVGIGTTLPLGGLFVKSGNVGISTIHVVPSALLHLQQTSAAHAFRVDDVDGGDSTPFVIDSAGNVGMGSLAPGAFIDIVSIGSTPHLRMKGPEVAIQLNESAASRIWEIKASNNYADKLVIIDQTAGAVRMSIDNTGNVGIGSLTPGAYKLDVFGNMRLSNSGKYYGDGSALTNVASGWTLGASNVGISTTNNVGIGTNLTTTAALSVMSGNVGIGTWKPEYALEVNGTTRLVNTIYIGGDNATLGYNGTTLSFSKLFGAQGRLTATTLGGYLASLSLDDDAFITRFAANNLRVSSDASTGSANFSVTGNVGIGTWSSLAQGLFVKSANVGISTIHVVPSAALHVQQTSTADAFRVDDVDGGDTSPFVILADGNVGIASVNPVVKLDVVGSSNVGRASSSAASAYSILQQESGTTGYIGFQQRGTAAASGAGMGGINGLSELVSTSSGGLGIYTNSTKPILIGTVATERMRIESGGNIGIGTDLNAAVAKLSVIGGNVGIGSIVPGAILDVLGNNNATDFQGIRAVNHPSTRQSVGLGVDNSGNQYGAAIFQTNAKRFVLESNGSALLGSNYVNLNNHTTNDGTTDGMVVEGNVGIGTFKLSNKLTVNGAVAIGSSYVNTAAPSNSLIVSGNVGIGTATPQAAFVVTNGNVGIGTWTASTILDVKGTVTATNFSGSGAGLTNIASGWTLGASNVGISTTNNVGIGSANPEVALSVVGSVNVKSDSSRVKFTPTNSSSTYMDLAFVAQESLVFRKNEGAGDVNADILSMQRQGGNVGIGTNKGNALLDVSSTAAQDLLRVNDNGTGDTTPFVINSVGNVGIGSIFPGSLLTVRGGASGKTYAETGTGITVESNTSPYIQLISPDASSPSLVFASATDSAGAYIDWTHNTNLMRITTANAGDSISFGTNDQSERIRIDSSGNVGFGTVAPLAALVVKAGNVGISTIHLSLTSAALHVVQPAAANAFRVDDADGGDGTPFIIDSAGNVGIGSSIPHEPLTVNGTVAVTGYTAVTGNGLYSYFNGANGYLTSYNAGSYAQLNLYGSPITFNDTSGERVRISTSGNIGIGTTTPQTKFVVLGGNVGIGTWTSDKALTVIGGARISGLASCDTIDTDANGNLACGTDAGGASGWTLGASNVGISTTNNVGIGTLSPATLAAQMARLHVVQSTTADAFRVDDVDGGDSSPFIINSAGNVGIGTVTGMAKLVIADSNFAFPANAASNGILTVAGIPNTAVVLDVGISTQSGPFSWIQSRNWNDSNKWDLALNPMGGNVGVGTWMSRGARFSVMGGNVGIGTVTAQAAFVVTNGNVGIGTWAAVDSLIVRSGNVGVGTFDAAAAMHVSAGNLRIDNTSDTSSYFQFGTIHSDGRQKLSHYMAGTEALVLSARGGANYCAVFGDDSAVSGEVGCGGLAGPIATSQGNLIIRGATIGGGVGVGTHKSLAIATPDSTAGSGGFGGVTGIVDIATFSVAANAFSGTRPGINYTALTHNFKVGDSTGQNNLGTSALFITSAANVGIGSISPMMKFEVVGNVGIGTTADKYNLKVNNTITFNSEYDEGSETGAFTINWNNGNKQKVTITNASAQTVTFTEPTAGVANLLLKVVQGDGNDTVTWPGIVYWPGGTEPTLSTTSGDIDIISCYYDRTNYYCNASLDFAP